MKYTRRQRVETALNHHEPDRVPMDCTIVTKPYSDLLEHFAMTDELWWDEWAHAFPKPEMLEKLDVDVMHLPFGKTAVGFFDIRADAFVDEWGCKKVRVQDENGGFLYQMVDHPLEDADCVEDILNYKWPGLDEPRLEGFEQYVKRLYNETDFALTMTFGGNVFERSHYLRGMSNFFMDLLAEPEMAQAAMQKVLDINLHRNKQILDAVGKYLTYFRFQGEDVGSQNGPLIAPDTFRQVVRPYLEAEWKFTKTEFLKHNPNGKVAIHSCGAVMPFIEDFISMGADVLNPIQPNAKGMDTKLIKELYGDRLSFHGAINSQPLATCSRQELIEEVKIRLDHLKKGGGYILSPSHNFQSGVSAEKIILLYDTAKEYGVYA